MSETEPESWLTYAEAGQLLGKTPDRVGDDVARAFDRALDALQQQLGHERARADRAERRIDELQDELARERCRATAVQRKLIEVLTGPRAPWWRRWFR